MSHPNTQLVVDNITEINRNGGIRAVVSNQKLVSRGDTIVQGDLYVFGKFRTPLRMVYGALFPDGTITNPSIAFTNEPDLGFARLPTGELIIVKGGVIVASFDPVGLTIEAITSATGDLLISAAGNNIDFDGKNLINVGSITSAAFFYDVVSTVIVTTTTAVPTLIIMVGTILNTGYELRIVVSAVDVTDGTSTATFSRKLKAKNISGVVTISVATDVIATRDVALAATNISLTVSGANVNINAIGTLDTIKWSAACEVLKTPF